MNANQRIGNHVAKVDAERERVAAELAKLQAIHHKFVHEVTLMRATQKAYYKGEKHLLDDSKLQEKKIDKMLEDMKNPSLFDGQK